jgi:hypothetical protein
MKVQVIIEISTPPTASNLDNLRSAASELTNNLKSIIVSTEEDSKGFSLTTSFTMKTAAQYKVVDRISKEFEFWTSDLVAAAAQMSPNRETVTDSPLEGWLSALTETEKQKFLLKLVRRESHVDLQLINRLKELAGAGKSTPQAVPGHRRLSELQEISNTVRE